MCFDLFCFCFLCFKDTVPSHVCIVVEKFAHVLCFLYQNQRSFECFDCFDHFLLLFSLL